MRNHVGGETPVLEPILYSFVQDMLVKIGFQLTEPAMKKKKKYMTFWQKKLLFVCYALGLHSLDIGL